MDNPPLQTTGLKPRHSKNCATRRFTQGEKRRGRNQSRGDSSWVEPLSAALGCRDDDSSHCIHRHN
ncbi:hypothetical protein B0O80DRAFT_233300 [Mortierella sp. GBAus27b]|nr:hypothetical protein B0O80DRAFT_233300 [Mortierella sp. GBAus27b]